MSASKSHRNFVNPVISALPKSGIREFFDIVSTMKGVISLGVGEPDFVTPWTIRENAIFSIERGRTSYTSNLGMIQLRREICDYLRSDYGLDYDPAEECLVTVGVSEALDLAVRAVVSPGDEVIYSEPCYVSYPAEIQMAGGVPVPLATVRDDDFAVNPERLRRLITPRTRVLMLNFPCNPTGAVMNRERLTEVAGLAVKHDLVVITDEIYSELNYGDRHVSIAALPGMKERTIFLHGFSKAFAMTGWRLGYAAGPHEIIDAMMKIHQYAMLCAPIMSQEAALEALRRGRGEMEKMREAYRERRDFIVRRLNEIGLDCVMPSGAFYAFPSIRSTGLSSRDFAVKLLKEESVAVVPGSAFGASGEGFIRCSYATGMDRIDTAMRRIGNFLDRLREKN